MSRKCASKTKLRLGKLFFHTFPKDFFSFKPKVAVAKFIGKIQKKFDTVELGDKEHFGYPKIVP